MNIAVLIKQVPSSEARIKVGEGGRAIDPTDVEYVINPYDEYAVEAALQAKEKFGGEVVAVALGPARVEDALRTCLALGADRAISLKDPAFLDGDSLGTARVLAAALRKLEAQVVFCGKVAIDDDMGAIGAQVAELLGWPQVSVVTSLEWIDETHAKISREIEAASEEIEVTLPAVLMANKGLNEPRYPSLKGIMAAKKKPMDSWDLAALGLDAANVGRNACRVEIAALEPPPARGAGQVWTGEPALLVQKLVDALKNERKLI
ncbi:MAG: electron transfer flavoprotein subunit beta/FixA family protein [Candidatus Eisenbacteria bacterium]